MKYEAIKLRFYYISSIAFWYLCLGIAGSWLSNMAQLFWLLGYIAVLLLLATKKIKNETINKKPWVLLALPFLAMIVYMVIMMSGLGPIHDDF